MAKKSKKVTVAHSRPRRVKPSVKSLAGVTIVDEHLQRLPGTYLDELEIYKIANSYKIKNIPRPSKNKLNFEDENTYDDLIAIWTDYFNKLFSIKLPLDVDMIKALIGSESEFILNPKNPDIAIPIAVRWLAYKKERAESKLGRAATHEEIILEYKGLLKSKSDYKKMH